MARILVVDDKEVVRDGVGLTLARSGHGVCPASDGASALEQLDKRKIDLVITDLSMPGMDGLELLHAIRERDEHMPVILMTAYGSIEKAVEAMRAGAWDFVTKPFHGDELQLAVSRALEHGAMRKENQTLRAAGQSEETDMVASAPAMQNVVAQLEVIAEANADVLLTGESGVGKEVAAKWIHGHSPRKDGGFLAVNCAALPGPLLESELFGHEKGAFTGAAERRLGRFELADGGTLLLDEIGELDLALQSKLLRVLQERTFERVGASRSIRTDVRVIAATNRDLLAEVRAGRFREDLLYRLNVLPVHLPPLRDRREDIIVLADRFLAAAARRDGRAVPSLAPDAQQALVSYDWPGNVRELRNICERAAVLCRSSEVSGRVVAPWLGGSSDAENIAVEIEIPVASASESPTLPTWVCDGQGKTLEVLERETILATLEACGGHRQNTARALRIGVRTLGLKLRKWKDEGLIAQDR
ncbi:MAG: sigma-54-dependent Fis family transcriptional regulator [Phycisphaera sp. TMED24]|jgi:DNA-binding NtrC family response regulator|nr:MAG: sigma-54-dependent Fis family transcriptional regulator [Phycisphaera sp. TMED24]